MLVGRAARAKGTSSIKLIPSEEGPHGTPYYSPSSAHSAQLVAAPPKIRHNLSV